MTSHTHLANNTSKQLSLSVKYTMLDVMLRGYMQAVGRLLFRYFVDRFACTCSHVVVGRMCELDLHYVPFQLR